MNEILNRFEDAIEQVITRRGSATHYLSGKDIRDIFLSIKNGIENEIPITSWVIAKDESELKNIKSDKVQCYSINTKSWYYGKDINPFEGTLSAFVSRGHVRYIKTENNG